MGNFSLRTKETTGDRVEGESSWLQLTIVSKQGSSLSNRFHIQERVPYTNRFYILEMQVLLSTWVTLAQ